MRLPSLPVTWRGLTAIAVGIFAAVWIVNDLLPVSLSGGDTLWSVPVAQSVVHQHNIDLDEFPDLIARAQHIHVTKRHGHYYFDFPWGPSVVSAPLVGAYDVWLHARGTSMAAYLRDHRFPPAQLEIRIASFWVAAASVLLFLLLYRRTKRPWLSVFVTFVFAFATSMVSTVSRALWAHGPALFFLLGALFLLQIAEEHRDWRRGAFGWRAVLVTGGCGFAAGMAYFCRPTSAIEIVVFVVALAIRRVRAALFAIAGAAIPIVAMWSVNLATVHHFNTTYYAPSRVGPQGTFFVALAGDLVSPARGLFVWSPILLLAIPAAVFALRRPGRDYVLTICVVVVVLQWLTIADLNPWWGGFSIGPRLFSDVVPFVMLLVADTLVRFVAMPAGTKRSLLGGGIALLLAFSLFTNLRAATHGSVEKWNEPRRPGNHLPSMWDWSDPQFLH